MNQPADDNPRRGNSPSPRARRTPEQRVVAQWRRLSGGSAKRDSDRPTLIACSGGADSSALAFALGTAAPCAIVLAYIAHDIRAAATVNSEAQHVAQLASRLGCRFASRAVEVKGRRGNLEAHARRLRYAALAALAVEYGCCFIATGHQATDQLETLLMRLARGSGPHGLRGIFSKRRLTAQTVTGKPPSITLIRPMLGITRQESEAICTARGWQWSVDATNHDQSLLRNALRHRIIPVLSEIAPGVEVRASRAAALQAEAAQMQDALVQSMIHRCRSTTTVAADQLARADEEPRMIWDRTELINLSREYGAGLVRLMLWRQVREASAHADRVDYQAIDPLVVSILGSGQHSKDWTIAGVEIRMTSRVVVFTQRS